MPRNTASRIAFVPPTPYSPNPPEGAFWFGTDSLWTTVSIDIEGWTSPYRTKLVYWRQGFDWRKEPEPDLLITAKRLDHEMPQVVVDHANAVFVTTATPAMMTGIDLPAAGCWEITAQYNGRTLSYITSLKP